MKTKLLLGTVWVCCAVAVSPVVSAKKTDAPEVKKDLTLDINESSSFSYSVAGQSTQDGQVSLGRITFPDISFEVVSKSVVGDVVAPPPECPVDTTIALSINFSQIWHLGGDALAVERDESAANVFCITPAGAGVIINLTVTGGTGPFACAEGGYSVNTVGFETPPELEALLTDNGLSFNPTAEGKGVDPAGVREGLIFIPADCP